ncbi:hypothetical protein, partial [Streptomyces europaeiscabiei]|uniref:hypothetical protein n=1 Tax=Streptomyces europaeiscabiei TaxID=146819 RepID=UPI00299FE9E5
EGVLGVLASLGGDSGGASVTPPASGSALVGEEESGPASTADAGGDFDWPDVEPEPEPEHDDWA